MWKGNGQKSVGAEGHGEGKALFSTLFQVSIKRQSTARCSLLTSYRFHIHTKKVIYWVKEHYIFSLDVRSKILQKKS